MSRHDEIMALVASICTAERVATSADERGKRDVVEREDARIQQLAAAISAAVAELVRDAERLDWMESHPEKVKRTKGYFGSQDSWMTRDSDDVPHDFSKLRPAIDLARAALAPKHHTDKDQS